MRLIPLTQGKYALVDDADYGWLSRFKWYAHKAGRSRTWYAATNWNCGDKRTVIRMHRLICPAASDVDHKNRNGLFNSRSNLRVSSRSQNLGNQAKRAGQYTSIFKGVSWSTKYRKWAVYIGGTSTGKKFVGYFRSDIAAAKAYDSAALKMYGDYARINFSSFSSTKQQEP